jgi:hypothetical protein
MSTIGALSGSPYIEPRQRAAPYAKTPPSRPASQYPSPEGCETAPTKSPRIPSRCGSPKSACPRANTRPFASAIQ